MSNKYSTQLFKFLGIFIFVLTLIACSSKKKKNNEESISFFSGKGDKKVVARNTIEANVSFEQIQTRPNSVLFTCIPDSKLITVYKDKESFSPYENHYYSYAYVDDTEWHNHFIPGVEVLQGENLLNIEHYNLKTEKLTPLFDRPVIIKNLYYPALTKDSLNHQPISRNYYLVSVYNEDTNKDTLINSDDLRRIFYFNEDCSTKKMLIPANYSVRSSIYDSLNDVMYIYARLDKNNNGLEDVKEPIHIFWVNLKNPEETKRMY